MTPPRRPPSGGLVYSTLHGRMCPDCRRPTEACRCHHPAATASKDGVVRVGRETKGRKGAGVTVVVGLGLPAKDLDALASQLKRRCGSGGTVRDGVVEIQGDHRDTVVAELIKSGWKAKRVGG
ncbi:MAG TPA: translation initiation factor Sui1 [Gemmatimonadales bacterium]